MFFDIGVNALRFTGRWNITDKYAETTAPGSMFECAFKGKYLVLNFDTDANVQPFPHLWMCVDDGAKTEVPLYKKLRIECQNDGNHILKLVFKSAVENQHRWYKPLIGKVTFLGFEAEDAGVLVCEERQIIEFIGDSITEGVLVDADGNPDNMDLPSRVHEDDSTATYAYLTAQKLNMTPVIMGYGAVGLTTRGNGSVPIAEDAYPFCYDGFPYEGSGARIIVINYGANDRFKEEDIYIDAYKRFLKLVRSKNSSAVLVVLGAFCTVHEDALSLMVDKFNKENNDSVVFVSTRGWIPRKPLHPLREGHKAIADKLSAVLKSISH